MTHVENINNLVNKLIESLPVGLAQCPEEMNKNFHQVVENAFNKLNLVTREEFDAQAAVLLRTREKLERLERILEQTLK